MDRKFVIVGIILLFTGVILGAFGAHGLKKVLIEFPEKIASFETGVRYQMYSGFTFLVIGLNSDKFTFSLKTPFLLWVIGTVFFSFSIYLLALQPVLGVSLKFLGQITPIGGLLLILGCVILLIKYLKK